ncbi:MAG: molybdopterin-dependent oxidoreductase, partial [Propionibacteriaceae bacterium]|nr:molybdopterin-dependent oxidoreductase [Propionibacteriaceae bacterium]
MTVTPTPSADLADLLAGRGLLSGQPRTVVRSGDDSWEAFYRDRWAHDKVVRTTHGVNCTGSCAWNVFVKDGLVTWEHQFTGYPTTGPDSPEYEPRGCPRGASFSWYLYSPSRVRYPYVRGVLLDLYRAERADGRDPVEAWAAITGDPAKTGRYKRARGQGGFVRASWDEVTEIMAAAHVATIRDWGPDRCVGFTPIPAMSMVSFSAGTRFLSLIGGTLLSFYDWYCDLPPASPQVWGDQTDVPESGDWWNAGYLMMWGSNIPTTRTPDSHFMTEVRYRGTKVVTVSPDYSDAAKFADTWLAPHPGTDAALAQAMGHVILTEFYRDQPTPYFQDYARRYTDAPFLIRLEPGPDGAWRPGKFLTAADLPQTALAATANADFRPLVLDLAAAGGPQAVAPNGTEADRFGEAGVGRWNLDLENLDPALSLDGLAGNASPVEVLLPRFDTPVESTAPGADNGATMRRGVPARRIGDHLVTTVFDVLLASYGVARPGLPGQWPSAPAGGTAYDDATAVGTPAWQETITGVPRAQAIQVGREFARNAVETNGRSMIILGAGTNHWFHSDTMYRTFLALLMMCGCQGVNGGGWAHYVGQEKARPVTGQQHMGFALDWARPPRHQASTSFWYTHSDQWRYDTIGANEIASPAGNGQLSGQTFMDCLTQAVRLGWTPGHPGFNRNPLDLTDQAAAAGVEVGPYIASQLKTGALKFAVEDPDDPACFPRVLTLWRANLFGNSAKGSEYFLRHILGAEDQVTSPEATP